MMKINRLKWYAARLAAMSPPEVLHRVREAALKRGWRNNTGGWQAFELAHGPFAPLPELTRGLIAAAELPSVQAAFRTASAGTWTGLGVAVTAEDAGAFFKDPIKGGDWPAKPYCFDIDVRSTGVARGDVKFVWEINRLQFLHAASAKAAAGDAQARELIFKTLQRWRDDNPPFRGVNWFSGIELAMRMVTLTLVVAALGEALRDQDRRLLTSLIAAHGFWLHRYPSRYSSANNHLVAEGLGLLLAGLLAPGLPHAAEWAREGRRILETEAALQIYADGVGGEQSPTYQAFTMEMLAFGALVARGAQQPLAPVVQDRLIAGARFLRTLMDTAGVTPHIGDDDEGRVIAQPPDREPRYVASIVAAVAGLAGDATLMPPAHDTHLRDALFAVPAATGHADAGTHCFKDGGYIAIRQTIAGRQMVLTFDHGPLGYLSLAAHGHADALAVWMSLDDQPVFVDAGTFLYHSGGAVRNALRSSGAHNTVTVCGQSQSVPSSAFSWSRKANAKLLEVYDGAEFHVSGQHGGYQSRFGVTHKRRIDAIGEGFMISDMLEGATRPLHCEICFLIHPALTAEVTGGTVVISNGAAPLVTLTAPRAARIEIVTAQDKDGRGVYSAEFGALQPTQQIVFKVAIGAEVKSTTVVIHG